jgi:hypothetical protein
MLAQKFVATLVSIGACPPYIEEMFSRLEPEQPRAESKISGIAQADSTQTEPAGTPLITGPQPPEMRSKDVPTPIAHAEHGSTDSSATGSEAGNKTPIQASLELEVDEAQPDAPTVPHAEEQA